MPDLSTIPKTMHAIDFSEPGGPEVLQLITCETPHPAAGDVLIRVAAAGVNRPDCLQRRGLYPPPPGASKIIGLEVSGEIVACGDQVRQFRPGDRVCALLAGGGYAEFCTAPAGQCLPVPAGLTLAEAAALPETGFTVWSNLRDRAQLQPGETLLVHGGASGIGTTAIQFGRALGATVLATAGTDEKIELCKRLGAQRAVNYNTGDFLTEFREFCGGADVILDIVGGTHLERNVKLLNNDGRLVVIGILGGAKGTLNLGLVLSKRLTVTGSTLRGRSVAEKQAIADGIHEYIWPHIERGAIRPVVQTTLPLARAAEAHELLENNQAAGKVVLIVDPRLASEKAGRSL